MMDLVYFLATGQAIVINALAIAGFLALCTLLCQSLTQAQHLPEEHTITHASAPGEAEQKQHLVGLPYRTDAFPGGRQFKTIYGTIQIFEWGPEDGEKVLIIHGLATPCISLGNMATEFVNKGYRVMIFGESRL